MASLLHLTIKTLWIGSHLSKLEQLCLKSFLVCGHDVELFVYDNVENIPSGVKVRDGRDILPESSIFVYRESKSVSAFSNLFRYEMLFREGGVWVDTDVICLKAIDINQPIFFGKESYDIYNGAVIGSESGQEIFRFLANQAKDPNKFLPYDDKKTKRKKLKRRFLQGNRNGNVKWGELGPRGFTKALTHFNLEKFGLPYDTFYPITHQRWDIVFETNISLDDPMFRNTYCLHLWNEMFRTREGFDKNASFNELSLIEQLKMRYKVF